MFAHKPLILATRRRALAMGVMLAIGCAVPLLSVSSSDARARHLTHRPKPPPRRDGAVAAQPFAPADRALPQWERDGVPGNGPFNNQLRKFSDPLGANGR